MTGLFVDTSALLAVLNADDRNHAAAADSWAKVIRGGRPLFSHNYVLVECSALVGRRLGLDALRVLEQDVVPVLTILWVTEALHRAAVGAQLLASRRDLSLVDCVSFEVIRAAGLQQVLAFDPHFAELGFEVLPS